MNVALIILRNLRGAMLSCQVDSLGVATDLLSCEGMLLGTSGRAAARHHDTNMCCSFKFWASRCS